MIADAEVPEEHAILQDFIDKTDIDSDDEFRWQLFVRIVTVNP